MWQSSNLAVVAATETVVGFDTEVFDKWAMHDNATSDSRLTPPAYAHPNIKGLWWVWAQARWASGATGYRCIRIRDAGNLVAESRIVPVNGSETWHECSAIRPRVAILAALGPRAVTDSAATPFQAFDRVGETVYLIDEPQFQGTASVGCVERLHV